MRHHLAAVKNAPLPPEVRSRLFEGKSASLAAYFESLWSHPMKPTDQDRLLCSLLTPARLLEFLRSYVLFDPQGGQDRRALLSSSSASAPCWPASGRFGPTAGREGRRGLAHHGLGQELSRWCSSRKHCCWSMRLPSAAWSVVTDRVDLEGQLSRNFISGRRLRLGHRVAEGTARRAGR